MSMPRSSKLRVMREQARPRGVLLQVLEAVAAAALGHDAQAFAGSAARGSPVLTVATNFR
ncbi:hypothetical protein LHFGNBLO_006083 (plasmid) [Mesorhizobium sp. AR10]|nr:hypothetical protein LHFGNBLO_006083 [Mesorhizobium sp. AR10]